MHVLATQNLEANHYISHKASNKSVVIKATHGTITLTSFSQNSLEVVFDAINNKFEANHLPSYAIKEGATPSELVVTESKNSLIVQSGKLKTVVSKSPFSLRYYQSKKLILEERGYFTGTTKEGEKSIPVQGFNFQLADKEQLIGGGERVLGMDRRGHRLPLYNKAHYGYETYSEQMNFSIPAVFSSNKYILLFDNSAKGWMDLGKTHKDVLRFESVSGRTAYIVFSGDSYPELIRNYVEVTGNQRMPPRWEL